jgi:hypothetical protein
LCAREHVQQALLRRSTRLATVRAVGTVQCLCVHQEFFRSLFGSLAVRVAPEAAAPRLSGAPLRALDPCCAAPASPLPLHPPPPPPGHTYVLHTRLACTDTPLPRRHACDGWMLCFVQGKLVSAHKERESEEAAILAGLRGAMGVVRVRRSTGWWIREAPPPHTHTRTHTHTHTHILTYSPPPLVSSAHADCRLRVSLCSTRCCTAPR